METIQGQTLNLPAFEETKTNFDPEDTDYKKINELYSFTSNLSAVRQQLKKFEEFKQSECFQHIQNIDLVKSLRGTTYPSYIKQIYDFEGIVKDLDNGFEKLMCFDHECNLQATVAINNSEGITTAQYCSNHSNRIHSENKKEISLELNLK